MSSTEKSYRHAAAILREWRLKNRNAPRLWLQINILLTKHSDMPQFWDGMLKVSGVEVMLVAALVRTALEQSAKEIRRQTSKEESDAIEKVIRLAAELKTAIEQSPLPRNWGKTATLDSVGCPFPPAELIIGWRDIRADGYFLGQPLEIVRVLDWAIELATEHVERMPPRSIVRHRRRPEITAFVRWLAWLFGSHFHNECRSEIALVTSAIFDGRGVESLTRKDVDNILKDRPRQFAPLLKKTKTNR